MSRRALRCGAVAAGLLLSTCAAAAASALFLRPFPEATTQARLRLSRPSMLDADLDLAAGMWDLRLAKPLTTVVGLQFECTVTAAAGATQVRNGLGNGLGDDVYTQRGSLDDTAASMGVGLQITTGEVGRRSCVSWMLGLPLTRGRRGGIAARVPRASNPYDRFRSSHGCFGVGASIAHERATSWRIAWQIELGSQILVPWEEPGTGTGVLHGGMGIEARTAPATLRAEYVAVFDAREDRHPADPITQALAAGVHVARGRYRPGLFVSLPLDAPDREIVDRVIGLELEVDFAGAPATE